MNGMHNEPFTRSHSPPVPDKFNKLKRKQAIHVDKGKITLASPSPSPSPTATGTASTAATLASSRDTSQVDDKTFLRGPKPLLAKMYEPKFIINEEEEEEEEVGGGGGEGKDAREDVEVRVEAENL